jgi:hypothetical protein
MKKRRKNVFDVGEKELGSVPNNKATLQIWNKIRVLSETSNPWEELNHDLSQCRQVFLVDFITGKEE